MTYSIRNHFAFVGNTQVPYFESQHKGRAITPRYLVIHFTAGSGDEVNTARWFQNPQARASAHINVGVDGKLSQSVPLNVAAWHAGQSFWKGVNGLNNHSIGIEVVNPGPLTKLANGRYQAWFGRQYTVNDGVFEARHPNGGPVQGWIPFTQAQIDVLLELGGLLMREYNLLEAVGHDMISPGRKVDPGPAMDVRVYNRLNGDLQDEGGARIFEVTSRALNFRGGPGTGHPVIGILYAGEQLTLISSTGGWLYVQSGNGLVGYVSANFVREL